MVGAFHTQGPFVAKLCFWLGSDAVAVSLWVVLRTHQKDNFFIRLFARPA